MGTYIAAALVVMLWWVLPGLVRLDLSIGGGLDGDGEEVVGVVSFEMENIKYYFWMSKDTSTFLTVIMLDLKWLLSFFLHKALNIYCFSDALKFSYDRK